jgi:hypothetical protein
LPKFPENAVESARGLFGDEICNITALNWHLGVAGAAIETCHRVLIAWQVPVNLRNNQVFHLRHYVTAA